MRLYKRLMKKFVKCNLQLNIPRTQSIELTRDVMSSNSEICTVNLGKLIEENLKNLKNMSNLKIHVNHQKLELMNAIKMVREL